MLIINQNAKIEQIYFQQILILIRIHYYITTIKILLSYIQVIGMQEQNTKKYASMYELINLPSKRKIIPVAQSLFELADNQSAYVTPAIKKSRNILIQNVEQQLEIFDDTSFNFKFPPSKFRDVPRGHQNQISYEQKVQVEEEDTFKDKLSQEQIQQMRQRGQFQVKSNLKNVKIPYIWKVNDRLLRGRVNIINIWENGLAFSYELFDLAIQNIKVSVPQKLKKLASIPSQLFTIIFGRKSLMSIYTPDYQSEVYKDFWTDIFSNELKDLKNQIGHDFLQKLVLKYEPAMYQYYEWDNSLGQKKNEQLQKLHSQKISRYSIQKVKIDSFKQSLMEVERKFLSNWNKIKRRILMKVSNQLTTGEQQNKQNEDDPSKNQKIKQKDKAILEKFHEQKYLLYTAHLKQHLPKQNISANVIEALVKLITIFSIMQDKMRLKSEKLTEIQEKTRNQIQSKYRIRSKNYNFKERLFTQIYEPIRKQVQAEFYQTLLQDPTISALLNDQYRSIYKKYLDMQKNIDNLMEKKKQTLQCIKVPERVFRTTYRLLPPYQKQHINGYYSLIKEQQMTVDTSADFWKIRLYGMRIKSWTINCAVFLLGFAWVGPFGLRCLFGRKDFNYDEACKYDTGEKYFLTRSTVLGVFKTVCDGVKKSRQYFQSLPDRGLFGKKFSRYFNYFECYVFRLFFVGIILVLILYPIAIVILSILCILLVITVWFWVPLIMLICYLFNIFIFQFQSSNRIKGVNITGIPLISLALRIIVTLVQCIYFIVHIVIVVPVITAIYSLFLIIQRGFRTFTDEIMLFLIKKLGRTPSRDTAIARKISGPTMARSHFYSINQEDVYVLLQGKLEQIHVNKFVSLTNNEINQHAKKFNEIMAYVLAPFGYSSPSLNYQRNWINRNITELRNHFNLLTNYYMARYPNNPRNIRFTVEEIDLYFENSVKIVKNFVEKQRIKDWIFDQYSVLYEDYEQLTRSLWISIFNCGEQIFQPLEKIESRFKIHEQNPTSNNKLMRQHVDSVMKALEGEVSLSHRQISFNPFKGSLLDKDRQFNFIQTICSFHNANSEYRVYLSLQDPRYIMIPPRNLDDFCVYRDYLRKSSKKNYKTYFQDVDID